MSLKSCSFVFKDVFKTQQNIPFMCAYTCLCWGAVQSVIRVVFHERRLQYMEREQLDIWRQTRPGERIVDIG